MQCALLGLNVSICGKIGLDEFGEEYFNNFKSHKINTDKLKRTNEATTGVACISVDQGGTNTIVVVPAANSFITVTDILEATPTILSSKVLLCQNEIPHAATLEAVKIAKQRQTLSIFNPAPALILSELADIISLADIVCPNETELALLTGLPTKTDAEVETAAKQLLQQGGCKIVLVTLGDRGAMIVGPQSTHTVPVPEAYKCTAIDTVGAGDCFIGISYQHHFSIND